MVSRLARVLRSGRTALALALAAGSMALAACGGDEGGTIPQANADALLEQVDRLEQDVASGNCSLATDAVNDLTTQINALPKEVGLETKNDLRDLATNLEDLLSQCQEPDTGASGESGVTPTTSTTTTTTETDTETDTGSEEPPEQPSDEGTGVPPDHSNAGVNGNGNVNGNDSGGVSGGVEG